MPGARRDHRRERGGDQRRCASSPRRERPHPGAQLTLLEADGVHGLVPVAGEARLVPGRAGNARAAVAGICAGAVLDVLAVLDRVVELGHELTVGRAGGTEFLVALFELEVQVNDLLLEVGDLLAEGADVGGGAEPGFPPGLFTERFGQAVFELLDAGGEPDRAFVGGGQVCLQRGPGARRWQRGRAGWLRWRGSCRAGRGDGGCGLVLEAERWLELRRLGRCGGLTRAFRRSPGKRG